MIVYGDYIAVYEDREHHVQQPDHLDKWQLWLKAVCHQTIFARLEVFDQVGKFDETLLITADWDWLLRSVVLHDLFTFHMPIDVCMFQMGGLCANRIVMQRNKVVMRHRYYPVGERIMYALREFLLKVKIRLESGNFSSPWIIRRHARSYQAKENRL